RRVLSADLRRGRLRGPPAVSVGAGRAALGRRQPRRGAHRGGGGHALVGPLVAGRVRRSGPGRDRPAGRRRDLHGGPARPARPRSGTAPTGGRPAARPGRVNRDATSDAPVRRRLYRKAFSPVSAWPIISWCTSEVP